MNRELAERVADAVLYEGYMLYPYRPSAMKNRQRWTFGTIYPPGYGEVNRGTESASMHTEFLLRACDPQRVKLHCRLRFLHLLTRRSSNVDVSSPELGTLPGSWDEATPRASDFELSPTPQEPIFHQFHFSGCDQTAPAQDHQSDPLASVTEAQHEVIGSLRVSTERLVRNGLKITIDLRNETPFTGDAENRPQALLRSLLSAHLILSVDNGEFVSLLDPPDEFRQTAATCINRGNFPVLVGEPGEHDMLLCSPILLYDYPQVAPESSGDFYDATEIDEMLTLRVLTLTDEEKQEIRSADDRVRNLLERTEAMARQQLEKTHGTFRNQRPASGK